MAKHIAIIIEDDPTLNEINSITLQEMFETESYKDGLQALQRLDSITPRLIILDLHLPNTSGAEILAKIRADERFAETRVILTTADERQAEMLREQADVVLLKPVSPVQLRELAIRLAQ